MPPAGPDTWRAEFPIKAPIICPRESECSEQRSLPDLKGTGVIGAGQWEWMQEGFWMRRWLEGGKGEGMETLPGRQ